MSPLENETSEPEGIDAERAVRLHRVQPRDDLRIQGGRVGLGDGLDHEPVGLGGDRQGDPLGGRHARRRRHRRARDRLQDVLHVEVDETQRLRWQLGGHLDEGRVLIDRGEPARDRVEHRVHGLLVRGEHQDAVREGPRPLGPAGDLDVPVRIGRRVVTAAHRIADTRQGVGRGVAVVHVQDERALRDLRVVELRPHQDLRAHPVEIAVRQAEIRESLVEPGVDLGLEVGAVADLGEGVEHPQQVRLLGGVGVEVRGRDDVGVGGNGREEGVPRARRAATTRTRRTRRAGARRPRRR